jgi:hypothetical protein
MELLLHQRNQTRQRHFVAASPRQQQTRDVGKRFGNARILRRFREFRANRETVASIARAPAHGAVRGGARWKVVDSGSRV